MTIQERIDSGCIMKRFREGWREGTVEELVTDYPFMKEFVENLLFWRTKNAKIGILKATDKEKYYYLYLYTKKARYTIDVREDYMGCDYTNRTMGILEDWHRGNDFSDGECNAKTLKYILYEILYNELEDIDDGSKAPTVAVESWQESNLGLGLGGNVGGK